MTDKGIGQEQGFFTCPDPDPFFQYKPGRRVLYLSKKGKVVDIGYIYPKTSSLGKLPDAHIALPKILRDFILDSLFATIIKVREIYTGKIHAAQANDIGIEVA